LAKPTGGIPKKSTFVKEGAAVYGNASFYVKDAYLLACTKYLELNPFRAGLVQKPEKWNRRSAGLHIRSKGDTLVETKPLLEMVQYSWKAFLSADVNDREMDLLKKRDRTGRSVG
jgi:putative transposase